MTIKRIEIPTPNFLNGTLIKDLQENEVICEECEGSGLRVVDYRYGIKGEDNSKGGFPYNKQTIGRCQHCYNGVRTKCRFCGELISRNYIDKCDCEGYKQYEEDKLIKTEQERFEKARKVTYEEYIERYPKHIVYDETSNRYHSDLEDLQEQCDWEGSELPKYVYGTYKQSIRLEVDSIIESACDELHEEAIYDLNGEDELMFAIDDFNLKNERNTATYYPNYRVVIML